MSPPRLLSFISSLHRPCRQSIPRIHSDPHLHLSRMTPTYSTNAAAAIAATNTTTTTTTTTTNTDMDPEEGHVKIHSRKQQQQQQLKTPAELEKEKWQEAHRLACEENRKKYIDPKTGYTVMTELLHKRRGYCCGNACRHCPYENENVGVSPEIKKANIERGKQQRKEIEATEGKPVWADDNSDDAYSD